MFQGAFLSGNWGGWSDFLERVDRPSALGPFSYEVTDTKLKRRATPKHVLQLVLYSDLLTEVQGLAPEFAHVELGDGTRVSLRLADYTAYARKARVRLEGFVADPSPTCPIPCADCSLCRWGDHCADVWQAEDNLFNVANISRGQVKKLEAADIQTMEALAGLDHPIRSMAENTRLRLVAQARLQHARKTGLPAYELRTPEPGKGFDLLPEPQAGDLFYDVEGDPHFEGGLEYLHGVWFDGQFRAFWAHDHAAEARALAELLEFFSARLAAYPDARIYHYAAYEITALRRLTTKYGIGEAFLDRLLRERRFVDLFAVVRGGLIASEANYSIKSMEAFYGRKREGEVKTAGGSVTRIIDAWIDADRGVHRKQRHTAKRVFDLLREEHGFTGGYTIVKDYMRERERQGREMFVPLTHPPGHAQADFGEATVILGGVERKAHFFAFDLPQSDACYIRAYPAATSEAWVDGHVHAFAFFGRAPVSVLYDNDKCLVARILPDGSRKRARLFSGFLSHYLIRDRYGRPGKGNDKGGVEGLVGYARRNFMVPVPRFPSWVALNAWLEGRCRKRQEDVLRGHTETIAERLARDLDVMAALPAAPFDACDQAAGRVSSQALVRYKTNDYSVPVGYGHRDVWLRGYVDEVAIGCGGDLIARHPRSYEREDVVFDPVHYLPLIEQKINAFDQAAPLADWDLPPEFATLRRLMEARMLKAGRREFVQVLRLLEAFELDALHAAVKMALRMGAISFDAVKHLVLCQVERRPPRLDLDVYPYLPRADVAKTSAASYMCLVSEAAR